MGENNKNGECTDSWEKSIDDNSGAKLKFPIVLKDEMLDIDMTSVSNIDMKKPERSIKTKLSVVDLSKKGRKNKNKGLF